MSHQHMKYNFILKMLAIFCLLAFLGCVCIGCLGNNGVAVTYGEFPFKLVYELNGETHTVEDIYVCEYTGYGCDTSQGRYHTWRGYVKSLGFQEEPKPRDWTSNGLLIYEEAVEGGTLMFYITLGEAEYYMDYKRPSPDGYDNTPKGKLLQCFRESDGISTWEAISDENIEKYQARVISFEYAQPIQNSFKD